MKGYAMKSFLAVFMVVVSSSNRAREHNAKHLPLQHCSAGGNKIWYKKLHQKLLLYVYLF